MLTLHAQTAADVMTPGPFSLHATASVAEATAFLTSRGYGAAVVIDDAGHPLGVVTKTDLLVFQREKADRPHGPGHQAATVRDFMTPATFTVRLDTPIESVLSQMMELNVHHLFVNDAAGVVVGVISPIDVLKKLK
ncbi:MAG: CBS domain-containing protein [Gemmataceae bacterium]